MVYLSWEDSLNSTKHQQDTAWLLNRIMAKQPDGHFHVSKRALKLDVNKKALGSKRTFSYFDW